MADELLTVKEVAKILKTNAAYVYTLHKAGILRLIKVGSLKCRKATLENFLADYDGKDISDPFNVKPLENKEERESNEKSKEKKAVT